LSAVVVVGLGEGGGGGGIIAICSAYVAGVVWSDDVCGGCIDDVWMMMVAY